MSITSSIRNKLDIAFRYLGVNAKWIKVKTDEKDDYGSDIITEEDPVDFTVVPYATASQALFQGSMGDVNSAEFNIHYLPSTTITLKINDKILYNQKTFKVTQIEELTFGEIVLMRAGLAVEH